MHFRALVLHLRVSFRVHVIFSHALSLPLLPYMAQLGPQPRLYFPPFITYVCACQTLRIALFFFSCPNLGWPFKIWLPEAQPSTTENTPPDRSAAATELRPLLQLCHHVRTSKKSQNKRKAGRCPVYLPVTTNLELKSITIGK